MMGRQPPCWLGKLDGRARKFYQDGFAVEVEMDERHHVVGKYISKKYEVKDVKFYLFRRKGKDVIFMKWISTDSSGKGDLGRFFGGEVYLLGVGNLRRKIA